MAGVMDATSEARLDLVCPALAAKIRQMAEMMEQERVIIKVTQGLRSWSEQARLYAQGRTSPGMIVTNAPPGHSYHQYGLAVDLVPLDLRGQLDWNAQHPVWHRLVEVGISLGLVAGAGWRTFPDWPHFQLTGTFPTSPDDEVRQLFMNVGMQEMWKQAGILST